jgi:putative ABC transport system substrate-binding protein
LVSALLENRLPAMMVTAAEVREGGLMSYFSVEADGYRALPGYVGRFVKGASPATLPVLRPMGFERVVNLSTARNLDVTVPPGLLLRADEVLS